MSGLLVAVGRAAARRDRRRPLGRRRLSVRRTSRRRPPAPTSTAARRSTRSSPSRSVRTRCCRRCSSRSRIRARTRATAAKATAAPTRTRSRGQRRRGRCRWKSIRRSCSSACSATAARRRSAPRARAGPQHPRFDHGQRWRASRRRRRRPIAARLDQYSRMCVRSSGACRSRRRRRRTRRPSTMPFGVPESFDEHIKLQFDLLALAFQADITRVGHAAVRARPDRPRLSGQRHRHQLPRRFASRRGPGRDRTSTRSLNRYHVKMLAYFLEKLRRSPTVTARCSITRWCSTARNMGNSNQHLHYDVPHVLIGGGVGQLQGRTASGVPDRRRCRPATCC